MKNTNTSSSSSSQSSLFSNLNEELKSSLPSLEKSSIDVTASMEASQKEINQLLGTLSLPAQNYPLPSLDLTRLLNFNFPSFSNSVSSSSMSPIALSLSKPDEKAWQKGMSLLTGTLPSLNQNSPLSLDTMDFPSFPDSASSSSLPPIPDEKEKKIRPLYLLDFPYGVEERYLNKEK